MDCTCDIWKLDIPKLNGCLHIAQIHHCRYIGEQFIYCPWCGKKLQEHIEYGGETD